MTREKILSGVAFDVPAEHHFTVHCMYGILATPRMRYMGSRCGSCVRHSPHVRVPDRCNVCGGGTVAIILAGNISNTVIIQSVMAGHAGIYYGVSGRSLEMHLRGENTRKARVTHSGTAF